jgi:hypothetical protein
MNALTPIGFATAYRQLSPAERAFVDAYVHEAEKASIASGQRISLVLDQEPSQQAVDMSRGLLNRPMVRAAIGERIKDIATQSDITMNMLIRELRHIAFASMDDYIEVMQDGTGTLDLVKATPEQRSAIQQIEIDYKPRGGSTQKIKLYDKQRAIEQLIELYKDRDRDWIADAKQPGSVLNALPATASPEAAADLYARMIADG